MGDHREMISSTRCTLCKEYVMNEQCAHEIWVWIWKIVIRGYDKATARRLKVSLFISSVHWKICMIKAYWFHFTVMWQSLWTPTVRKFSWQLSVRENMHISDESAALLYKTHCNKVTDLILLIIICHIYVFGLRTMLWRQFWLWYQGRNYTMCMWRLLLLLIKR